MRARLRRIAIAGIVAVLGAPLCADSQTPAASEARDAAIAWLSALRAVDVRGAESGLRPGSRLQWSRSPQRAERARAAYLPLGRGDSLRVVVRREWAALLPPSPGSAPPVLLHREEGVWRVDWVEVEKSYLPGTERKPFANSANPYRWLAEQPPGRAEHFAMDEVDLLGEPLDAAVRRLERAKDPADRLRLGEILWRNCWLVGAALDELERVAVAERKRFGPTRQFAEVAWAVGEPDRALPLAERWQPASYDLLARLHARAGRFSISQEFRQRAIREHVQELRGERMPRSLSREIDS